MNQLKIKLLSFEIDTLEIVLKEQVDVVDKFFIVEANFTHHGRPKPMLWKLLRALIRTLTLAEQVMVLMSVRMVC